MDRPCRVLGPHHRILRHGWLGAVQVAASTGDPKALAAYLVHLAQDRVSKGRR